MMTNSPSIRKRGGLIWKNKKINKKDVEEFTVGLFKITKIMIIAIIMLLIINII